MDHGVVLKVTSSTWNTFADRPPAIDINEVDPNGQVAVKRRLPPEVKQKLAKVARLSVCGSITKSTCDSILSNV